MNKGLIGAVIVVVIIGSVVGLFIRNTGQNKTELWQLLPNTPDMVMEVSNPVKLFNKLKTKNNIRESLLKVKSFHNLNNRIIKLDSTLKSNPDYHNSLFSSRLIIAFYGDSAAAKTLFVSELSHTPDIKSLTKFLKDNTDSTYNINLLKTGDYDAISITNNKETSGIIIAFADNMMIASASKSLITKSLEEYDNHSNQHFTNRKSFNKLQKTAGKKVNTHLYFNGGGGINLISPYISENSYHSLLPLGTLFQWTETDLFLKNDEFIMNGLSIGNTDEKNYQRFLNQKPQNQNYINILPSNTTLFLFQGISDFSLWQPKTKESDVININKLTALTGPEIVFVSTARDEQEFIRKSFMVVRFEDAEGAKQLFDQWAKKSGKTKIKTYGQYKINKLKDGNLCAKAFGEAYNIVTANYYVFIDDYVIIGNSADELTNWLQHYETGKTLDLSNQFKKFEDKLTESSNFTLFVGLRDFSRVISRFVNIKTASDINNNQAVIKQFEGLLLQLSSQPPFVYTGLFVKQNDFNTKSEASEKVDKTIWKLKLEDDIAGKPFPVKDHTTGRYNIVVFDKSFNAYLIKYDGSILWKKQLDGLPESDVYQVDYFKNNKIQYLFNTASFVYLIDKNGNYVKKYPIKINPSATNGLSVFDYNKKRDYRILLAQSDKRVYNYDLKGKKIKGWKPPKMQDIVVKPIQRLVANKKDYLIVTDIKNNAKIFNRKGVERIKIKGKLNKAVNSKFYVNRTNSKGLLITTNETGKLVYISSSGRLRYTDFGNFSPNHYFLYEDFDGNGSYDFIYVDGDKLTVFDRFKKILFSYQFKSDIQIEPIFFRLSKTKKMLGIVSDKEKTIYLFDKHGKAIVSKDLSGEIPFTVTSLKNNREINLITGSGNTLFNYKIK